MIVCSPPQCVCMYVHSPRRARTQARPRTRQRGLQGFRCDSGNGVAAAARTAQGHESCFAPDFPGSGEPCRYNGTSHAVTQSRTCTLHETTPLRHTHKCWKSLDSIDSSTRSLVEREQGSRLYWPQARRSYGTRQLPAAARRASWISAVIADAAKEPGSCVPYAMRQSTAAWVQGLRNAQDRQAMLAGREL